MMLFDRSILLLIVTANAVAAFAPIHNSRPTALRTSSSSQLSEAATKEVDCLVVGSGVSGSCLAFNLAKHQGVDNVLMVERNDVVGGNLISKENDEGFVWEEGPNSFQPTPYICRIVHELGITKDLVLADGSLPRFVYWKGGGAGGKLANLHALPTNLPGDLLDFTLLTWPGKIRAGLGAVGLIAPPPTDGREESIREFVTRHLGPETFERVIDPFVSGVYAGDPDELAMAAALKKIHRLEGLGKFGPGLVSGALERFKEIAQEKKDKPVDPAWPTYKGGELGSFRKGLQTLALAAANYLGKERVWTDSVVEKIEKLADGRYQVVITKNGEMETVTAKCVCLTSPTRVTCKLAADLIPAAARLSEVYSPPVASVTMAYKKEWFRDLPGGTASQPLRGFGHLLPRAMGVRSLGTIWSSSLFPGRAPEGWELLLTYIGGARDRGIADLTEDEIYKQVDMDNHQILLKSDAPAGKRIGCRVWKTAIPQYRKGHLDILAAVEKDEAKCPGFFLGGNYRTGVAFGDCVQFGWTEAERVANFLASNASSSSSGVVESKLTAETTTVA
jgi:protoporphyrinogen/coproporphyrinogen III oxidase